MEAGAAPATRARPSAGCPSLAGGADRQPRGREPAGARGAQRVAETTGIRPGARARGRAGGDPGRQRSDRPGLGALDSDEVQKLIERIADAPEGIRRRDRPPGMGLIEDVGEEVGEAAPAASRRRAGAGSSGACSAVPARGRRRSGSTGLLSQPGGALLLDARSSTRASSSSRGSPSSPRSRPGRTSSAGPERWWSAPAWLGAIAPATSYFFKWSLSGRRREALSAVGNKAAPIASACGDRCGASGAGRVRPRAPLRRRLRADPVHDRRRGLPGPRRGRPRGVLTRARR